VRWCPIGCTHPRGRPRHAVLAISSRLHPAGSGRTRVSVSPNTDTAAVSSRGNGDGDRPCGDVVPKR
jgi:hypothetical protein